MPLVLAQPPQAQTTTTETGLQIAYPKYDYVKQGEAFTLHAHVINATTLITNTSTSCFVHLYDPTGSHTAKSYMDYEYPEFEVYIEAGNFSTVGIHAYIIQCNSTRETGFVSGAFEITPTGYNPEGTDGLSWGIIALSFLPLVLMFVFQSKRESIKVFLFAMTLIMGTLAAGYFNYIGLSTILGYSGILLGVLIVYVVSLIFFISYFLITYMKSLFSGLRDVKRSKTDLDWEN